MQSTENSSQYDVVIIGGGPGGSTAAVVLARAGLRTIVLDRTTFPRFRIGETHLPRLYLLMKELDLLHIFDHVAHVPKLGVEFAMGDAKMPSTKYWFSQALHSGTRAFNVERAAFDTALLDEARRAGAEVRENATVKSIPELRDGSVKVVLGDGQEISGKYLLDCSGQASVVGRHLGTRKQRPEQHLQRIAYFQHFNNVERLPGREEGHACIALSDEGWIWMIPLNATRTSIGLVMDASIARTIDVPANKMLQWGIERCPFVRNRMRKASGLDTNQVVADFSYTCKPYAGDGHFLIGDAAAFLDPIFSTGTTLSMMSANEAANHVINIIQHKASPAAARRKYIRYVEGSTSVFWKLIENYYNHSFRELFLNGSGPVKVHSAVLGVLAGSVFPKPKFALRWRMRLFYICMHLQKYFPMVTRRDRFSLRATPPVPRGGGSEGVDATNVETLAPLAPEAAPRTSIVEGMAAR